MGLKVAVVGVTGAVGVEMLRILEERAFPVDELVPLASARSAGRSVSFRGEDVTTIETMLQKMGYEVVEYYGPYYQWTTDFAKEVRKLMDDTGIRCNSTHNGGPSFSEAGISKAIDLNTILGSKYVVMASAGRVVSRSIDASTASSSTSTP